MWHIARYVLVAGVVIGGLFWVRHVIRWRKYRSGLQLFWDGVQFFLIPFYLITLGGMWIEDKLAELNNKDEGQVNTAEKGTLSTYRLRELQAKGLNWKKD